MPQDHNIVQTPAYEGADELSNDLLHEAHGSTGSLQDDVADDAESNQEAIENLGDRVIGGLKSVASDPGQMVRAVRDLVLDYPLASLATVALASLALGRASRR